jgi:Tol biopolymer transport system component
MDVWILELDRGALTRLTFDGYNLRPIWSPDGRRVIFGSNRVDDTFNVFSKAADGSREAEEITRGAYRIPTSLSSDGRLLIFRQPGVNATWDIGVLRLDGENEPKIILGTDFDEHTGMLSPNDRLLAYVSNESGREEVYVCSFPDPGGKVQVSTEGGTEPMWSRDGNELFYRNGEKMMAVAFSTAPDFAPSRPTLLFEGPYEMGRYEGNPSSNYDVSPDGRFVMVRAEEGKGPQQMNIVLNWAEELKRLVPVN